MSNVPENLQYTSDHVWLELISDHTYRVGITHFAQEQLGDMVYLELPEPGLIVNAKKTCAVIESVKSAADIYSPLTGQITEINNGLLDEPEQINDAPYSSWLFCLKATELSELDSLLDASAYAEIIW